jgi:hypothetical protein
MKAPLIIAAIAIAGCADDKRSGEHHANAPAGYSLDYPSSWSRSTERGFARFAPRSAESKTTILVRSSPKPAEIVEGRPTSQSDVLVATEHVLRSLPRAKLASREPLAKTRLPGARFFVTFTPPGLQVSYQRVHVTLVGVRRVFHVILTAPSSERLDEAALTQMVSSLREEV